MRLGMSYDAVLWQTPYSVLSQLMHAEASAQGSESVWINNDTPAEVKALLEREFEFSWQ